MPEEEWEELWNFDEYSDRIAVLTEDGREYSYRELSLFRYELAQQIRPHTLTVLLADNDMGSLVGYLSCLWKASVPVMLPAESEICHIVSILAAYHPEYIWLSEEKCEEVLPKVKRNYARCFSFLGYTLLIQESKKEQKEQKQHPELALLLSTSGSTGAAKQIRISRKNLLANTKSICEYLSLSKEDRAVTSLPMSYTYGLSVLNTHLYVGGSIFLTRKNVLQKQFWNDMNKFSVTFLSGVPYTFEIMKKIRADQFVLPKLRILTQAGGRLSEELQKYWGEYAANTAKQFYVMYGQTEATARISYLPPEDCLRKAGSVGIAVSGSKIGIVDENHKFLHAAGQQGEIVCMGPHISMGYAKTESDLGKGDENGGILFTGDIGYLDEEGYLFITGREKRIAKIQGKRIDLTWLETKAAQCFGQEVTALSDDQRIYLFTDAVVSEKGQKHLMRQLGIRVNIFVFQSRDKIPRKGNGKIDYRGGKYGAGSKKRN